MGAVGVSDWFQAVVDVEATEEQASDLAAQMLA